MFGDFNETSRRLGLRPPYTEEKGLGPVTPVKEGPSGDPFSGSGSLSTVRKVLQDSVGDELED